MTTRKIQFYFIIIFLLSNFAYAQFQNVRVDNPNSNSPNEVTIAINPLDPMVLAAGSNLNYFYGSTDGGNTWSQINMASIFGVWGDPCVIFDGFGNLYYGHLSNPQVGYWIDRIVVQKSTDNGLTWNDGAGVGLTPPHNQDKEWIAVDMTQSQYQNNLYMSWTEFDDYGSSNPNDSSRILFSYSTNQGDTWSDPIRVCEQGGDCIDSDNTVEGAVPAVGPNGEIYVSWSGPLGILFDKSTDGGVTWGSDIYVTDQPGGWDFNVSGIFRCNGLPITACDVSNSPYNGNIYINWTDQRNGGDNTDVFIIKSTDGGETWGNVAKVNDDNTSRHQFFTWMTIDQSTGYIYVVFYDRRNTSGAATDVYIARSIDGGNSFANFKVSESSFTPNSGVFFGDYTNIAAMDGKVYPIWMRADNTSMSVWTALVDDQALPVELSSFTAQQSGNLVNLSWRTETEINNHGFEIERKLLNENDDGNWNVIGFMNGRGTTATPNDYSYDDDIRYLNAKSISYRLKQIDFDGSFEYSSEVILSSMFPTKFVLHQNYPNPFNPATTIGYEISQRLHVSLKLYDALGNEVATLVNDIKNPGNYEITMDGSDLSSGIYFYELIAGDFFQMKKMTLLK